MRKISAIVVITVICSTLFGAEGFYFKQKNTIGSDSTISNQYIINDFIKSEDTNNITILSSKELRSYDKNAKTYFVQSLASLAAMTQIVDSQFEGFDLKKTGKTSKVGEWDTENYHATFKLMGMDGESEIFICKKKDLPSDLMLKLLSKMYPEAKNIQKMVRKLEATGGFQVKSITKIKMGEEFSEIISEIVDAKKMDMDEKSFIGPDNYKQIDPPANPLENLMKK